MKEMILRANEPGTDFLSFPWADIRIETVDRERNSILKFLAPIHEDALQDVMKRIEDFYRRKIEENRALDALNLEVPE